MELEQLRLAPRKIVRGVSCGRKASRVVAAFGQLCCELYTLSRALAYESTAAARDRDIW